MDPGDWDISDKYDYTLKYVDNRRIIVSSGGLDTYVGDITAKRRGWVGLGLSGIDVLPDKIKLC